jgi:hypothetical protein
VRGALYLVKLFGRGRYTPLHQEFFASADKKCANALLSMARDRPAAFWRFFNFNARGVFYLVPPHMGTVSWF